jgi:hypothetical protein
MFGLLKRRRKQQKLIADFVRALRHGMQQRAELTQSILPRSRRISNCWNTAALSAEHEPF